ncbi:MAG: Crp/Fnr family transcriptional regulator [Gemmatimonadaceae bacterium]
MTRASPTNQLLTSLSSAGQVALLKRSVERRFATGEILWSAGDRSQTIALVLEGKVRIVRGSGGRQTVIHSGEAGATLGEVPFFTGDCYPATAIAAEPTRCLFLTHAAVTEAMAVDPRLAFFFLKRLSMRVQHLAERVDENTISTVQTRLARFILDKSQSARSGKHAIFSLGMTQTALAEELGTVREVVVRSLRALRQAGAIDSAGDGKYRVTSLAALERLAQTAS